MRKLEKSFDPNPEIRVAISSETYVGGARTTDAKETESNVEAKYVDRDK
jgi:hypothetical protein